MSTTEFLQNYLKSNPEFSDNLKEDSFPLLAAKISSAYVARADRDNNWQLVHRGTNEQVDVGSTIHKNAWEFLKRRGNARYLPKFQDRRKSTQIAADAIETRVEFESFLKKLPIKWINDEPVRVLTDWVSRHCLFECNGKSAPVFALMANGVCVEKVTGHQLVDKISRYIDQNQTELETKRLNAKWRSEALTLQGLTNDDLRNDPQAAIGVDRIIGLIKDQHYSSSSRKKLPSFGPGELISDLEKETAHDMGIPVNPQDWDYEQRRAVNGAGERRLEEIKQNAWGILDNFISTRPVSLYESYTASNERYEGLDYEKSEE